MKGRTILIVLIIVLLLGSGGIYLFMRSQSGSSEQSDSTIDAVAIINENGENGNGEPAVVVAPSTPLPNMVGVVVSNQTFQRGYYITDADVNPPPGQPPNITLEQRVATSVNDNVITDLADVVGKFARSDVFQGQTFTEGMLADDPRIAGAEKYGPSSLIPQGQVAAALPFDRLAGVAYALSEGDYIDIMLTFNFYQIDEEFQTYLQNSAVFYLQEEVASGDETDGGGEVTETRPDIMMLSPYGRFEELATGDTAHIYPSEKQRPIVVSMVLQNAKVIQVGDWSPRGSAQVATPTPTPLPEDAPTPTPDYAAQEASTPVPRPPDVILLALSPQQQLLLKYAVESYADIDYALRQPNDGQLYNINAVDLDYMLAQFNIELPPTYNYSVDSPLPTPEATPETIDDAPYNGE